MKQNVILFAIVGILAGTAIGAGVGYVVFNDSTEVEQQAYWYFIDYGDKADATHVNGWIKGNSNNSGDALVDAAKKANLPIDYSDGYVKSINGIEGGMTEYWVFCALDASSWYATGFPAMVQSGAGVGSNAVTITALVFGQGSGPAPDYLPLIKEPKDASWKTTGPFAAAVPT